MVMERMVQRGVKAMFVVDENNRPEGVITINDLISTQVQVP